MGALESLIPSQWVHTGDSEVECRPNWAFYQKMESSGACVLVVAREYGKPVGYMAAFIYPHTNAIHVNIGEIPTYYVKKGRVHVLSHMQDFMIEELVKRNVFKIKARTKAEHSAGRLWELKGFELDDFGYTMKLKKPQEAKHA
jgi:hypothetical protein